MGRAQHAAEPAPRRVAPHCAVVRAWARIGRYRRCLNCSTTRVAHRPPGRSATGAFERRPILDLGAAHLDRYRRGLRHRAARRSRRLPRDPAAGRCTAIAVGRHLDGVRQRGARHHRPYDAATRRSVVRVAADAGRARGSGQAFAGRRTHRTPRSPGV